MIISGNLPEGSVQANYITHHFTLLHGLEFKGSFFTAIKIEEGRQHSSYQAYHHHEHHWGPYFEGQVEGSEGTQVAAHVGAEALLNCRVGMLKDKTVCLPTV